MPTLPDLLPDMPEPRNDSTPDPAHDTPNTPVPHPRDDVLDFLRHSFMEFWQQQPQPQIRRDYSTLEQRVIAAAQLPVAEVDLSATTVSNRYLYRGAVTGRMYMHQQEVLRHLIEQNPPRRNPWPFETWTDTQPTQEPIMTKHDDTYIITRIDNDHLNNYLDRLLSLYREGTAEGDDIKARFEVGSSISPRADEPDVLFRQRSAYLAACYGSNCFPPEREMLKRHVVSMLTGASRNLMNAYSLQAQANNGDGAALVCTGRKALHNGFMERIKERISKQPEADINSLRTYFDAPPRSWCEAEHTAGFAADRANHNEELRRERALIATLDVDDSVKDLMNMYLTRAGNNYANALRYYHVSKVLHAIRDKHDTYLVLMFYTYKRGDTEVRGLQFAQDENGFIEGFGAV